MALKECPRRAFFEYYPEGEPESADAWRLKELTTLPMWAGSVVDYVIGKTLAALRDGEIKEDLGYHGQKFFRKGIERSLGIVDVMRDRPRTKAERQRSKFKPLQHHYYRFDVGDPYIQTLEHRVAECVDNFERSATFEHIKAVGSNQWDEIVSVDLEYPPSFLLNDNKVWAAFDFRFRDGGTLYVLDWKTGEYKPAAAERQLGVYALHAAYEKRWPIQRIRTQAIWLRGEADWDPKPVDKDTLRQVRDGILDDIAKERGLLDIVQFKARIEYRAHRQKFPPKTGKWCLNCKYREICPEGQSECAHV